MKIHLLHKENKHTPEALKMLSSVGDITFGHIPPRETEILVTRLSTITGEMIASLPLLRAIGTSTTGTTHIDIATAAHYDVRIIKLDPSETFMKNIFAASDHAFGLILSLFRRYKKAFQFPAYSWSRYECTGMDLAGKTLGIIGYGRIGKRVEKYAEVFGMDVIHIDRDRTDQEFCNLLKNSDVILIAVPFNEQTRNMIKHDDFIMMKRTAFLVNISRGEVIMRGALWRALMDDLIAGAAIDVMHDEDRNGDYDLIKYAQRQDRLIITPHIGGCTFESLEKTDIHLAQMIIEYVKESWIK